MLCSWRKVQQSLGVAMSQVSGPVQFSSFAQSCLTLWDSMDCNTPGFPVHHQLPRVCWNSCLLSWWCHLTVLSSVVPFSCPQSFPAPGYFPMSQFFFYFFSNESVLCWSSESLFYQEWGGGPGLSGSLLPSVLAGSSSGEVRPEHIHTHWQIPKHRY